jgi:hypothetical protein
MKKVKYQDFDFSLAAEYRKVERLLKQHVSVATEKRSIVTYHSSGQETENSAQVGDYIIKTSEKDDGYVITRDRFAEIYEEDKLEPDYYCSKIIRSGLLTLEDVIFVAVWGKEQHVKAGGMIIDSGQHIYGIDGKSFVKKYGRVDQSTEKNIFALLSDDLEYQLSKAKSLDLQNHIFDISTRMQYPEFFQ